MKWTTSRFSGVGDGRLVTVGTPLEEKETRDLLVKEKTGWLATVSPKKNHI